MLRRRKPSCLRIAAALILATASLALPASAVSATKTYVAVNVHCEVATFELVGLKPATVRAARVTRGQRAARVDPAVVRRGARRGRLRLRLSKLRWTSLRTRTHRPRTAARREKHTGCRNTRARPAGVRRKRPKLIVTTTAESAPPPPSPSPPPPSSSTCSGQPFCADWETGDFTQWAIAPLSDGTGTVTVSSSQPVRQGAYSARFRTAPATGTQRAEVNASQAQTGGYPGQEWWYGWWTYFPAAGNPSGWWTSSGDSNVIAQFQSVDWTTQIYIGIDQGNYTPGHTTIYMNWRGDAKSTLVQDLQYDHWYHFVVHAKWSTDPAVGFLSVDVDGATAKPLTYGATLANATTSKNPAWTAPGAYAELDNYHAGVPFENTVIHDGFCRAATSAAAEGC